MGQRPLTGYHVYAFTIPMLILHLPYVMGVDWSFAGELITIATYFVLAVVWDYLWFVMNPAYTVARFRRGNVWWFEVPWIWRFPLDYYLSIALSIGLAALAALDVGDSEPLTRHLWFLAGLAVLVGDLDRAGAAVPPLVPAHAPEGADDRASTPTYGPPAPELVWSGGDPDLHPLAAGQSPTPEARTRGTHGNRQRAAPPAPMPRPKNGRDGGSLGKGRGLSHRVCGAGLRWTALACASLAVLGCSVARDGDRSIDGPSEHHRRQYRRSGRRAPLPDGSCRRPSDGSSTMAPASSARSSPPRSAVPRGRHS